MNTRKKKSGFDLNLILNLFFVREPLYRLLSAFKDKFIGKNRNFSKKHSKVIVKVFRPKDFDPNGDNNVTFSEFVQYTPVTSKHVIHTGGNTRIFAILAS